MTKKKLITKNIKTVENQKKKVYLSRKKLNNNGESLLLIDVD